MTKDELIQELINDGYLKSPAIIEAFQKIDRADFVLEEYSAKGGSASGGKSEAYGNYPLPIGQGQTISQPLTVAFMLELLEPKSGDKILDIGSGSGWQTALLANIVGNPPAGGGKIIAIERVPELKIMTEKNVGKYSFIEKGIVKIVEGDGSRGYQEEVPYDRIIAAAAGQAIPEAWKEQLKIGGRIVAPVNQSIYVLNKVSAQKFEQKQYFGFSFVPLISDGI